MKKRILSIALIASLVLSAAGCGGTGSTATGDSLVPAVPVNVDKNAALGEVARILTVSEYDPVN